MTARPAEAAVAAGPAAGAAQAPGERTGRLRAVAGAAGLAGVVAGTGVLALTAATGPSGLVPASRRADPGWLAGPWRGPAQALGLHPLSTTAVPIVVLCMLAAYAAALWGAGRLPLGLVAGAIVAANLVAMLAPPLGSADVFGYIDFARMGVLHGLSPYTHDAASAAGDPVVPFVRWREFSTPYGPGFTALSYPLAWLSVPAALWTLKAVAAASALAVTGLCARTASRRDVDPRWAAAFVGLSPVMLIWAVGGAHNDLLILIPVAAGILWFAGKRERASGAALAVATGMKVSFGLLLPFLIAGSSRRREPLIGAVAGLAGIAVLGAILFGPSGLDFVSTPRVQQDLVATFSVPATVSRLLGFGSLPDGLRWLFAAGFAVTTVWMLVWTWRGGDWIRGAGWSVLALLVATAWLLPWYVVWVLPLAALARDRRLAGAAFALSVFVVAIRIPGFGP